MKKIGYSRETVAGVILTSVWMVLALVLHCLGYDDSGNGDIWMNLFYGEGLFMLLFDFWTVLKYENLNLLDKLK